MQSVSRPRACHGLQRQDHLPSSLPPPEPSILPSLDSDSRDRSQFRTCSLVYMHPANWIYPSRTKCVTQQQASIQIGRLGLDSNTTMARPIDRAQRQELELPSHDSVLFPVLGVCVHLMYNLLCRFLVAQRYTQPKQSQTPPPIHNPTFPTPPLQAPSPPSRSELPPHPSQQQPNPRS